MRLYRMQGSVLKEYYTQERVLPEHYTVYDYNQYGEEIQSFDCATIEDAKAVKTDLQQSNKAMKRKHSYRITHSILKNANDNTLISNYEERSI